jgi:hypothetical protein
MSAKLNKRLDKWKRAAQTLSNHSSLSAVVMALNGENPLLQNSENRAALVRYVEAWNEAKRNPWKMQPTEDGDRFSLDNLGRVWTWRLAPIGRTPHGEKLIRKLGLRVKDEADEPGGAFWAIAPNGENCRDLAAMFAGMLLTNPLRGKLSDGPCQRDRCKRWFIKRRLGQKCCSQRCGAIVKTAAHVSDLRKAEKKENLKTVRAKYRQWRKSKSGVEWKVWVSEQTGLSTKFLTRNFTKEGRIKKVGQKGATDTGFKSELQEGG